MHMQTIPKTSVRSSSYKVKHCAGHIMHPKATTLEHKMWTQKLEEREPVEECRLEGAGNNHWFLLVRKQGNAPW